SAMAFAQLVGAFSLIITQFQSISSYAAVVTRLGVLDEGIEQARTRPGLPGEVCTPHDRKVSCPVCAAPPLAASAIDLVTSSADPTVTYDHVTLLSPSDGRVLTKDMSGSAAPGGRLLILGPVDDRMQFMSERPYLPPGTLREALTSVGSAVTPEQSRDMLRQLGLETMLARVGGLEAERRWDNILSL